MQGDADVRALVAQMAQLATVTSTEDLVVRISAVIPVVIPRCVLYVGEHREHLDCVQRGARCLMRCTSLSRACTSTQRIGALSDDEPVHSDSAGEGFGWQGDIADAASAGHHADRPQGAAVRPGLAESYSISNCYHQAVAGLRCESRVLS